MNRSTKPRGDRKKAGKLVKTAKDNLKRLASGEFRLAVPSDLDKKK